MPLLEHVNYLSYLISEREGAPRANRDVLAEFLLSLADSHLTSERVAVLRGGALYQMAAPSSIDFGQHWFSKIARQTKLISWPWLPTFFPIGPLWSRSEILPRQAVARLLDPLRRLFPRCSLFGVVLGDEWHEGFFRELAYLGSATDRCIFFMPNLADQQVVSILDPLPPLRALAETPVKLPAVVFWSPTGEVACALPAAEAEVFYRQALLPLVFEGPLAIDRVIKERAQQIPTGCIVHLSDFHFGEKEGVFRRTWNRIRRKTTSRSPARKRQYIKAQLHGILKNNDRIVITGDQMDTPDGNLYDEYTEFKNEIERFTERPVIDIPGNHDMRSNGNRVPVFGSTTYEWVGERTPIVVDNALGCVFFCFNSLEIGHFARGSVTDAQLQRVAIRYEGEIASQRTMGNDEFDKYLKVALVHHHPCTYVTRPSALYDRVIRFFTRDEDKFVRFDNAESFLEWCAARDVSLILHGHKHVPYHIRAWVPLGNRARQVMIVSCGSTMGAEGSPLCYDVISLNRANKQWSVSFFRDASSSFAGFNEQEIEIDLRRPGAA
jgi:hypothetical protein